MADHTDEEVLRDSSVADAEISEFRVLGRGGFALVPGGYDVKSLESFQATPNRIVERRQFSEVPSLSAYVSRFATEDTIAFADWRKRSILSMIDYHTPPSLPSSLPDDETSVGAFTPFVPAQPSHNDHSAEFIATLSPEYAAWSALARQGYVGQKALGEFLEDRAIDVVNPDPATIMDIVLKFEVTRTAKISSGQKLSNGTVQFQYVQEDGQKKGAVAFPEVLFLRIPLYEGGNPIGILVRLRYDITDGVLRFAVKIADQDNLERAAFEDCVAQFAKLMETAPLGVPPIYRHANTKS